MANRGKNKGDYAEREVQELLRHLLGNPKIRRALGAGRHDDVGDIDGVSNTCIQVAWRENLVPTIQAKLKEVEHQRKNRRVRFSAVFIRKNRYPWFVVMSPEQWAKQWKYAQIGLKAVKDGHAVTPLPPKTKMSTHGTRG